MGASTPARYPTKGEARLAFCGTRAAEQAAEQLPFVRRRKTYYKNLKYEHHADIS